MSSTNKPWYTLITIDLLALILERSLFNPFITWLIPLCLRAVAVPTSSPKFLSSCLYATFITLFHLLNSLSQRLAYGAPRTMDWSSEVVVVTGGARGLGRVLVGMLGLRGVSVAVLDVGGLPSEEERRGEESLASVRFYRCDVGNEAEVLEARGRIERELGTPTILINNAAIVHGKNLLDLSTSQIEKSLRVNILAHFNTIRAFLPGMLSSSKPHDNKTSSNENDNDNKNDNHDDSGGDVDSDSDSGNLPQGGRGGIIVTISSVLGKLGAAQLTDYTASKAAVIALHKSLAAELSLSHTSNSTSNCNSKVQNKSSNVKTILVTPGQLSTPLFSSIATPSNFLGPVVDTVSLAKAIIAKIDAGQSGEVSLPLYARYVEFLAVLPIGVQIVLRGWSGVDSAMASFTPSSSSLSSPSSGSNLETRTTTTIASPRRSVASTFTLVEKKGQSNTELGRS